MSTTTATTNRSRHLLRNALAGLMAAGALAGVGALLVDGTGPTAAPRIVASASADATPSVPADATPSVPADALVTHGIANGGSVGSDPSGTVTVATGDGSVAVAQQSDPNAGHKGSCVKSGGTWHTSIGNHAGYCRRPNGDIVVWGYDGHVDWVCTWLGTKYICI